MLGLPSRQSTSPGTESGRSGRGLERVERDLARIHVRSGAPDGLRGRPVDRVAVLARDETAVERVLRGAAGGAGERPLPVGGVGPAPVGQRGEPDALVVLEGALALP